MKAFNINQDTNFGQTPIQLRLWDLPSLNPTDRLKTAMREAVSASGLSREKVVSDMNALANAEGLTSGGRSQKITIPIFDKWLAGSATAHRIPIQYLPIFCKVTGSMLPLKAMIAPLGGDFISAEDAKLLQWAKIETQKKKLTRESNRLAQEVGIK